MKRIITNAIISTAVLTITVIGLHLSAQHPAPQNSIAPSSSPNRSTLAEMTRSDPSLASAIETARYGIEQNEDTFHAENPAQDLRSVFGSTGELHLQGASQDTPWRTNWKLTSVGRGTEQRSVIHGVWSSSQTKIAATHRLDNTNVRINEYFENRPDGLEQVFTLDRDPDPSNAANLSLILKTEGDLKPTASENGQKIVLTDASGTEVLQYHKLRVWDANGITLTANMTTNEHNEIALIVEDANAVYPLTIDPTFIQSQRLTANDGTFSDKFGSDVAISADTMIIGARGDSDSSAGQGSAYIFVRSGNAWIQQAKLVPNDGGTSWNFGNSVAISGDTAVVGANGANSSRGAAYVFVRSGTTWSAQEKLVAPDGAGGDNFGSDVSIAGDSVVVGAYLDTIGLNIDQGSAYAFVRNGGAWAFQQKLVASDGSGTATFGISVSQSGSTVIIGAPFINNSSQIGAAYVFVRSGSTWTQQVKLTASDGAPADNFGFAVDLTNTLSGTIAVVGAMGDDVAGNSNQGSAYVFSRPQVGIWSQTQKILAPAGADGDSFGGSVSISPTVAGAIVVGAFGSNGGVGDNQGSAYLFSRVDSVWTMKQKLTANDGEFADYFGNSVAVSIDTVIIGAVSDSIGQSIDQGSAYIFSLGNRPFDFDGDGKTDLSIFRPSQGQWWINRSGDGQTSAAAFGSATDIVTPADLTGDGKTDVALFRPSNGNWFVLRSDDNSFYSFPFGTNGDIPAIGDFDGDATADAAVFRPSTATWYVSKSVGGTDIVGFGAAGDKPVVADYDGDGKADIAIFRPNGAGGAEWWVRRSSNSSVFALQFGASTDKAVPGDFTGDGKADVAFWRPSTGFWNILRSEDFSYYAFPFGANGDVASPGDYDGDGKIDAAVFRPSNSTWFANKSGGGTLIQQFGIAGDVPVPSAFVR